MWTVPVVLRQCLDWESPSNRAPVFATSIISFIPVFLVFLFGQRFWSRASPPLESSRQPVRAGAASPVLPGQLNGRWHASRRGDDGAPHVVKPH